MTAQGDTPWNLAWRRRLAATGIASTCSAPRRRVDRNPVWQLVAIQFLRHTFRRWDQKGDARWKGIQKVLIMLL